MVPKSATTPATVKARRVLDLRCGHAGKCGLGQADEVMVTDFEIRMELHLTTHVQNGCACQRGCIKKAPFGATLSAKSSEFVCLDGISKWKLMTWKLSLWLGNRWAKNEFQLGSECLKGRENQSRLFPSAFRSGELYHSKFDRRD